MPVTRYIKRGFIKYKNHTVKLHAYVTSLSEINKIFYRNNGCFTNEMRAFCSMLIKINLHFSFSLINRFVLTTLGMCP